MALVAKGMNFWQWNGWPFGCRMSKLIKFFVIYTLWGHQSGSKNRIVLGFIAGPKIEARRHFLINQIRIFIYFIYFRA